MNSKPTRSRTHASLGIGRLFALLAVLSMLVVPASALAQTPTGAPTTEDGPLAPAYGADMAPTSVLATGDDLPESAALAAPDANMWLSGFCSGYSYLSNGDKCMTGDFNGDGRDDVIRFIRNYVFSEAGRVYVALSTGTGFQTPTYWNQGFPLCTGTETCGVGDFDGDGDDDIVAFHQGTDINQARVWVALSNGRQGSESFAPSSVWNPSFGFCLSTEACGTGDFDGDGDDDIVAYSHGTVNTARVWIALSNGKQGTASFGQSAIWNPSFGFCATGEICSTGDFNGDRVDDAILFARGAGAVWVATSTKTKLNTATRWNPPPAVFCVGSEECRVGDLNGDRRDDAVSFLRSSTAGKLGHVYVAFSTGSTFQNGQLWTTGFCLNYETCDLGDFDGNGRDDLVTFAGGPTGTNVWVQLSPGPPGPPQSRWVMSLIIKKQ